MAAKQNIELIEELLDASQARDWERYGRLFTEDASLRMAGVPRSFGGVVEGRDAIVEQFRDGQAAGRFEVRDLFADDNHVCVIGKLTATSFPGNPYLRGADHPYSMYECQVYRLSHGLVQELIVYANWLDAYVQTGLVDPATLTGA
jgi:ketosteroid isomerase-like protein